MNYTKIKMNELQEGDIFAAEIKLRGREAFIVDSINEKTIGCISRTTGKSIRKRIEGSVYLLKKSNHGLNESKA